MQWAALFVQQFSIECRPVEFDNKRTKNGHDMLLLRLERPFEKSKNVKKISTIL
ncbi:hypothetical protein MWU76_00315 [Gelidibacter sp. F2691]|nr:hypothetical protein [Gelidibacter sp. F2691]